MFRFLYSLLLYLITPLIWIRLIWRGRRQSGYLRHVPERYGFYGQSAPEQLIWVHAVSVGETRAAAPLVERLLAEWPESRVLLTCMTPTGREAGAALFGDRVIQAYLPYDYPGAVARFFRHFSPRFGVILETELWPNLLATAQTFAVPVVLANARLSERSARGYGRVAGLIRPALSSLAGVAAQTPEDADRLTALGASRVEVTGNLKFDVLPGVAMQSLGQQWRATLGHRQVWLAASTREGEEEAILAAWAQSGNPDILLVLVPRHPQRFDEVADLLRQKGLSFVRRSAGMPSQSTAVWLGDSMGEMVAYYTLAEVAFVGGSLLPLGGQNLIEAAACDCPVLIGQHTFNFKRATEDAIAAGAARRVSDAETLTAEVLGLLRSPSGLAAMRQSAMRFAQAHRGACDRLVALIRRWMGQARH